MAEQVIFGKTSKRINSISQTYTPVITTNVLLKEPCSVVAPIFLVKQNYATLRECNYAQYAGFYYYITDVVSVRNKHVEVRCSRDPLASFANDIRNAWAYASFADALHGLARLDDPRMGPDLISTETIAYKDIFSNYFSKEGTIVMRAYANLDNTHGNTSGVRTYFMDCQTFFNLLTQLNSTVRTDMAGLNDIVDVFKRISCNFLMAGSIKDQIIDCYWVPTPMMTWQGAGYPHTEIALGAYKTGYNAFTTDSTKLFEVKKTLNESFQLPTPMTIQLHPWLRGPKYLDVQLYYPGGVQNISCPELIRSNTIYLNMAYGCDTGDYVIAIKTGSGHSKVITTVSGSLRIDLLARAKAAGGNMGQMLGNFVKMGVGMLAPEGQTTTDSISSYANATTAEQSSTIATEEVHTTSVSGGTGIAGQFLQTSNKVSLTSCNMPDTVLTMYLDGDTNWGNNFYICCMGAYPRLINENNYEDYCSRYGFVCNDYLNLGTVDGFVQCVGASVEAEGATQREIASINSIVNSGIYIEA